MKWSRFLKRIHPQWNCTDIGKKRTKNELNWKFDRLKKMNSTIFCLNLERAWSFKTFYCCKSCLLLEHQLHSPSTQLGRPDQSNKHCRSSTVGDLALESVSQSNILDKHKHKEKNPLRLCELSDADADAGSLAFQYLLHLWSYELRSNPSRL